MSTIKLLDGTDWAIEELLKHMLDDDFYYGYLGTAALSSSSIKKINDSPREYARYLKYGESGDVTALVAGNLIHTLLLEPHLEDNFTPIECASKSTNIWKNAVAEYEGTGKKLLLRKDYDNCHYVVKALLKNKTVQEALADADYEIPEIGLIQGIPFRAKADIKKKGQQCIFDLKTTSNIDDFYFSAKKYGYAAQAYIYCTLFDVPFENFKFIVVDKMKKDIGVFSVSESFFSLGQRLVEKGVSDYIKFFINNEDLEQYVVYGEL
tara:strand:+ start:5810 stop:6604 length:795 start_codon:yes stop_codon:yes gene_type:complete